MRTRYPNLELMEYQAAEYIKNHYADKIKELKNSRTWFTLDFEAIVFKQSWTTTATAFDIQPNGSPVFAGQAFTEAYTVIMYESTLQVYVVFVNDRICYVVENPTEKFMEDMNKRQLLPLSKAKELY